MGERREKKASINITMDTGVLERLDAFCKRAGLSRSAYITYVVATGLDSQERILSGVTSGLANSAEPKD